MAQMVSETDNAFLTSLSGVLPGTTQTVPKGELYMLWLNLRSTTQYLTYVTDNQMVHGGWRARKYEHPTGEHA